MNKFIFMIVLVGLTSGCGIFKTKKLTRATDLSSSWEASTKKEQQLLIIRDSVHEDQVVEITPIGNFSYSIHEGFRGSGSAIKITGRKGSDSELVKKTSSNAIYQQAKKKKAIKITTDKVVEHSGLKLGTALYGILAISVLIPLVWIWLKNWRRSRPFE